MITKLIFALFLVSTAASADDECLQWMLDGGVLPGSKDCELSCAVIGVDMGTFMCPNQCEKLCKSYLPDYITNNLTWAGNLTDSDKALIKKFPLDALKVYQSKRAAEESTKRLFKDNFRNDESDAFRHFVWSGLLTKKLGRERAQLFLDSHESSPDSPPKEVDMDKFNNSKGISMDSKCIWRYSLYWRRSDQCQTGLLYSFKMGNTQQDTERFGMGCAVASGNGSAWCCHKRCWKSSPGKNCPCEHRF